MALAEGDVAPNFTLPATGERTVSLHDYKGQPFILYFYPRADTPGCTKEACAFQDSLPDFAAAGLGVLGVSPDKIKPLEKFATKYNLTFPLATDEDHAVAEACGTWVEKAMYGKKYMGIERSTFLIAADGRVRKIWRKVSVANHAADVMMAAKATR